MCLSLTYPIKEVLRLILFSIFVGKVYFVGSYGCATYSNSQMMSIYMVSMCDLAPRANNWGSTSPTQNILYPQRFRQTAYFLG